MATTVPVPGGSEPGRSRPVRGLLLGAALIAVPVGLLVAALGVGSAEHHARAAVAPALAASAGPFPRLLIALPVILAACYLAGAALRWLGQPPVIGEIIAGVLLGPSLLGLVWHHAFAWLFPADVVATISTLSQIGLIFFLYLVGARIDLDALRGRGRVTAAVSHVSVALPMVSGAILAIAMYSAFGKSVGFLPFALFIAVVMSVTAFPVLARILTDRGIADTQVGVLALSCAAICDVAAWCLLAMCTAISRGGPAVSVLRTVALTVLFALSMLYVVRPLLRRLLDAVPEQAALPILLAGIMLAALATNQIGVHPMFGAFLFGIIAPRRSAPTVQATGKMESITIALLLPLFFVYTGLHTQFGLLGASGRLWAWTALITAVAIVAKWGGSTSAARLTGLSWPDSMSLGALMNCRGLTELVVLGVGLQLHVISPTVFTMLVIMTLIATMATSPALGLIARFQRAPAGEPELTAN